MRLVLGCRAAADGNEARAALELLTMVDLKGAIVTADALHCHKAMVEGIRARGGDYALAIKGNQPSLLKEAKAVLGGEL
jgi:predicted transposase YbfD/YdcC